MLTKTIIEVIFSSKSADIFFYFSFSFRVVNDLNQISKSMVGDFLQYLLIFCFVYILSIPNLYISYLSWRNFSSKAIKNIRLSSAKLKNSWKSINNFLDNSIDKEPIKNNFIISTKSKKIKTTNCKGNFRTKEVTGISKEKSKDCSEILNFKEPKC